MSSAPEDGVGIECRECGCRHFFVIYTRAVSERRIMRRRECRHCGWRITTYERVAGGAKRPHRD